MNDFGKVGSATHHERYSERRESRRTGPRNCWVPGCQNKATHRGMANGVCLTTGCEFHTAMWVRDPLWRHRRQR